MPDLVWTILRVICYLALVIVLAGFVSLVGPFVLDLCREAGGGQIACDAPIYRSLYEFGFTVVMMSVFTGLPALLALGGVCFGIHDVFFRNRQATPK